MLSFGQGCFKEVIRVNVFVIILINLVECKKCMRNADIGWRQGNIYFCDSPELPECCEIDRMFTCCEPRPARTIREQLQLWGTILIFCMMLALVYLYFKRDAGCCTSPTLADSFRSLRGRFIFRKKFHSLNDQYKELDDPTVKMVSPDMRNDRMNWQFRQKPLI